MSWFILRGQVTPKMLASLADLARTEEGREAVISADLLPQLLNRVGADSGEEMALQACRHHHRHHHLRKHNHHHHCLAGLSPRRQPVFRLALWQSAGRGGWPLEVEEVVVVVVHYLNYQVKKISGCSPMPCLVCLLLLASFGRCRVLSSFSSPSLSP